MPRALNPSTGNVFADLGFPAAEAAHLRIRAELMLRIARELAARGLTQARAATLLGVTQPRISALVRGRMDRFSIDTLVEMLDRLGVTVTVTVRKRRGAG
jgi:predicted XRE-type DNA-binding protein